MINILIAAVVSFGAAGITTYLIRKVGKNSEKSRKKGHVLHFLAFGIFLFLVGGIVYFGRYYHADAKSLSYLESGDNVKVSSVDEGYFFDGPGDSNALIFYPGAKVEATSYSAIMYHLAEEGVDCFIVEMPLNMAMFGKETAGKIMSEYSYDKWYISGHSLGGAMASIYAAEHSDELEGIILMASYSTEKLSGKIKLLSLVGSKDEVVNREAYDENKANWPQNSSEYIIEGGNHAQFGDYGQQKGDGKASISSSEQQRQTVEQILEVIEPEKGNIGNEDNKMTDN